MTVTRQIALRPLDPAFLADPYPSYARLRQHNPIAWAATPVSGYVGFWFVSRYADVTAGLKDNRFGREITKVLPPDAFPPVPAEHAPLYAMIAQWMLFKDPPTHGRLRKIAAPMFSLRSVMAMRSRIEALIDAAMATLPERGPFDVVSDLASPLSIDIVAELMGVPEADHALVRGWVREITLALDLVRTPERIRAGAKRAAELVAYFDGLVQEERRRPRGNLLSLLMTAQDEGSFLSQEELLASCVLFLLAGHEASSLLIGNGLAALAAQPQQYRRLRTGEVAAKTAVAELLRFDSPQQIAFRQALADVEFQGASIRMGQSVGFGLGSANRDPAMFAAADTLDLARGETRHMAFSAGIHTCAGSSLANLEAELVFTALAQRLPKLEIVASERQESIIVRGYSRLVLDFGA